MLWDNLVGGWKGQAGGKSGQQAGRQEARAGGWSPGHHRGSSEPLSGLPGPLHPGQPVLRAGANPTVGLGSVFCLLREVPVTRWGSKYPVSTYSVSSQAEYYEEGDGSQRQTSPCPQNHKARVPETLMGAVPSTEHLGTTSWKQHLAHSCGCRILSTQLNLLFLQGPGQGLHSLTHLAKYPEVLSVPHHRLGCPWPHVSCPATPAHRGLSWVPIPALPPTSSVASLCPGFLTCEMGI